MAVLTIVPGIEAKICINDEAITEYDDMDDVQLEHPDPQVAKYQEARTVSKYVECMTNASFSIKVSVGPPYKMDGSKLGFHITVDGRPVWKSTCGRPHFKHHSTWTDIVSGVKEGKGAACTMKAFKFAKIETSEYHFPFLPPFPIGSSETE